MIGTLRDTINSKYEREKLNIDLSIEPVQTEEKQSKKPDRHPVFLALNSIEQSLGVKRKALFKNRLESSTEEFNDDPLFISWKSLYEGWEHVTKVIEESSFSSSSSLESDCSEVLDKVLSYPKVERKSIKKSKKLSLPKHLTADESIKILEALEKEKKRKEIEKEAKLQKKLKLLSSTPIPKGKNNKSKATKIQQPIKENVEEEEEEENYECAKCGGYYSVGVPWVKCDTCEEWLHARCTRLKGKSPEEIDLIEEWNCELCL